MPRGVGTEREELRRDTGGRSAAARTERGALAFDPDGAGHHPRKRRARVVRFDAIDARRRGGIVNAPLPVDTCWPSRTRTRRTLSTPGTEARKLGGAAVASIVLPIGHVVPSRVASNTSTAGVAMARVIENVRPASERGPHALGVRRRVPRERALQHRRPVRGRETATRTTAGRAPSGAAAPRPRTIRCSRARRRRPGQSPAAPAAPCPIAEACARAARTATSSTRRDERAIERRPPRAATACRRATPSRRSPTRGRRTAHSPPATGDRLSSSPGAPPPPSRRAGRRLPPRPSPPPPAGTATAASCASRPDGHRRC